MRIAATLTPLLLLLPASVWAQAPSAADPGHFEGWPDAHWGADKQSFEGRAGLRGVETTFAVAKNGFGWHRTYTGSKDTFNAWGDVTAWCWGPGTVAIRMRQRPPIDIHDLDPEALRTIVESYFQKYAADAEWSAPEWQCTPRALNSPPPANTARIVELLEAAGSEPR